MKIIDWDCISVDPRHYGLGDLPPAVRRHILKKATKRAGWKSVKEKGDGSSMMVEWITYGLTVDEWIKDFRGYMYEDLPDKLKQQLWDMDNLHLVFQN